MSSPKLYKITQIPYYKITKKINFYYTDSIVILYSTKNRAM